MMFDDAEKLIANAKKNNLFYGPNSPDFAF